MLEFSTVEIGGKLAKKSVPARGRLIGYARVSTVEQNLDMQIEALKRAGVDPGDIHVEKVSASSTRRPKLAWVLDALRPGDTLVVWKFDRLARSMIQMVNLTRQLDDMGVSFKSLTEQVDTSTPGGTLLFHMLAAGAQFERDMIRQRTRAGVEAAMARGQKFGVDPKLSKEQIKEAQWMRDDGVPVMKIAKHFAVAHTTIYGWTKGKKRPRQKQ